MPQVNSKSREDHSQKAEGVIVEEKESIHSGRDGGAYRGLALSGGGIRSASFGLGVMQAMAAKSEFGKMDYMSTVSGGGYIGTAVTWFLRHRPGRGFPFGSAAGRKQDPEKNAAVNYIRQNAGYLTPGQGLNLVSFLAVILRGMLLTVFVYGSFLLVGMKILDWWCAFDDVPLGLVSLNPLTLGSLGIIGLFAVTTLGAGLASSGKWGYDTRRRWQRLGGMLVSLAAALAVLASIPYVASRIAGWVAGILTGAGGIAGAFELLRARLSGGENNRGGGARLSPVVTNLAAASLAYGLLLGAYLLNNWLKGSLPPEVLHISGPLFVYGSAAVLAAIVGLFTDYNNVTPHRAYRDRLMELFMPDMDVVAEGKWRPARTADGALLENFCDLTSSETVCARPFHIVNTNLVLVDADNKRFRDRGGDSFVLTPLRCGSDATGWWRTEHFQKSTAGRRGMTLATAMAISGAAVNPNTGAQGRGVPRNRLVSMLMGLLNLRLGYWIRPEWTVPGVPARKLGKPNLIRPGLAGVFLRRFDERAGYMELSDGGHFDNTGIYELLRRNLTVIVLSDASGDPDFKFGSLASALERARVSFGVKVRFREDRNLEDLVSCGDPALAEAQQRPVWATRGHAIADITYSDESQGTLIYIRPTLTSGLPVDLTGYRAENPSFPAHTTADQFFDEQQFEAYRELGYQLAKGAFEDSEVVAVMD